MSDVTKFFEHTWISDLLPGARMVKWDPYKIQVVNWKDHWYFYVPKGYANYVAVMDSAEEPPPIYLTGYNSTIHGQCKGIYRLCQPL